MPDGKAHVRNEVSGTTERAAAIGADRRWGPVSSRSRLPGSPSGRRSARPSAAFLDKGVSGDFIDDIKGTLTPGKSALFLVVKQADADAVIAALRDFRGEVIQTTLDSEAEEALRQALD